MKYYHADEQGTYLIINFTQLRVMDLTTLRTWNLSARAVSFLSKKGKAKRHSRKEGCNATILL